MDTAAESNAVAAFVEGQYLWLLIVCLTALEPLLEHSAGRT